MDNPGILLKKYIDDENVLNVYVFGSHVYGTANEQSDVDSIIVVKNWFDSEDINVHVYTVEQFTLLLSRCDIQAMECVFADDKWVLKREHNFAVGTPDKHSLRSAISTITSNSWVKGKKKLTVAGDYDMNLAIKSVFHSLRILDYGIQIASSGKIQNFGSMNYVLEDIRNMSKLYQREELWQKIDDKYRKMFNAKGTEFKLLAPKNLSEKDKKIQLEKIVSKHFETFSAEMLDEILNLFQN